MTGTMTSISSELVLREPGRKLEVCQIGNVWIVVEAQQGHREEIQQFDTKEEAEKCFWSRVSDLV